MVRINQRNTKKPVRMENEAVKNDYRVQEDEELDNELNEDEDEVESDKVSEVMDHELAETANEDDEDDEFDDEEEDEEEEEITGLEKGLQMLNRVVENNLQNEGRTMLKKEEVEVILNSLFKE